MHNGGLKEVALQVLHATVTASEKWLKFDLGQPEVPLETGDWPLGDICRIPFKEELDAQAISQLSHDKRRLEYIVQLSKALFTTSSELLAAHERRIGSITRKISKGLDSLPDEVLGAIFNFATLHKENGTCHALWLSHVSRRFRIVALRDHSLWSTIRVWRNATTECIEECISRSGRDTDLHVIFNFGHTFTSSMNLYLARSITPFAHRWRSLTLANDWHGRGGQVRIGKHLDEFMQAQTLVLPRLHELNISQLLWPFNRSAREFLVQRDLLDSDAFDVQPWEAPNLRVLRCVQYIPPNSFPFTCITTFSISFMLIPGETLKQVEALFQFLSIQHNIATLNIEIDGAVYDLHCGTLVSVAKCPAVTKFSLGLRNFDPTSRADVTFRPVWRSLLAPNLEDFVLSIDCACRSEWQAKDYVPGYSTTFGHTGLLFPHPDDHPKLTSVTVNAMAPRSKDEDDSAESMGTTANSLVMNILLDRIPRVTKLTIKSFSQVSFSRLQGSGVVRPSQLEELRLRFCGSFDAGSLRRMVQSLKEAQVWETLEGVYIEQCDLLEYRSAMEVVGEERLRFES